MRKERWTLLFWVVDSECLQIKPEQLRCAGHSPDFSHIAPKFTEPVFTGVDDWSEVTEPPAGTGSHTSFIFVAIAHRDQKIPVL